MLRPATPLTILLFIAFVLLLLSVLSTPIIKGIPLASFKGVDFGVFGYCKNGKNGECTGIKVGYATDSNTLFGDDTNSEFTLPNSARSSLSSILVVHPVAALLTLVCTTLAASSHLHSPSHSPRFLLALLILLIPTLLVTLLAFLVDILLFVPHMRWGGWIVLVSTILIVASGVVTCAMRRTLVSRKARKKRIAQNAEMSGENFYNRQNAPVGARAETPPPLTSQPPPPMVNGAPGADKLPNFTTYEKNPRDFEEDRIPLNTRTLSNRTLPSNGTQPRPSEERFEMQGAPSRGGLPRGVPRGMRGGRGGYGGPRDEYGNPLPPSNAFGPIPGGMRRDQSEPRPRGHYSDENINGSRGRGRGGFPPRGYGRGVLYGPGRGGPNNGRGMPVVMAAGAGAGMMAGDMRNHQGPPPDYSNRYPPMGGERPGHYEQGGPAGFGRSPSAPAYGMRSPGPPSTRAYDRQPSPDLPSHQGRYARQASPGPPSHPGGFGRQPSPGGRSARGGYGRQSPGPPRTSGEYARQRSFSNPRSYDYGGRQPSPGGYQGQGMRAPSPTPPMPEIPANEPIIGQAIEMDATTGNPSHTPTPIRPMQLRDSDSDVQELVGLQQQREHRESPLSLTSVYSSQEPYVPPRTAWANPATRTNITNTSNLSHNVISPITDSPIAELPAHSSRSPQVPQLTSTAPDSNSPINTPGHTRYNSADNYYEDVDPRFAEPPEPHPPQKQSSAPLPAGLTAGLHPQPPQHGVIENTSGYDTSHLQPSHSYDSIPDNTHDAGARSPAVSDGSNYSSISQRGINPQWQPPPDHAMGMGGLPNRKPVRQQQNHPDVNPNQNPDFELPIHGGRPGTGGRLRAASRGRREPGMIPGMEPGAGRYPGNARMAQVFDIFTTPRPDLKPIPGTIPLTPQAAILPPLIYYFALLLLPPFPPQHNQPLISAVRSVLALTAGSLFFQLPLKYHVPFSVGLTYQLALIGLYGGCRVLDAFFISPYLFGHIPRRVKYHHEPRSETPGVWRNRALSSSYFDLHFLQPRKAAITETATTDERLPESWKDRASWALELELSMRGAGFTWTSADVRHTKKTWTPTAWDRIHSILLHVLPVLGVCFAIIRYVYLSDLYIGGGLSKPFDNLSFPRQVLLTAALGGFLMTAFSLGHSTFAIILAPLKPHPLSYFPPLYTTRVWDLTTVRSFWSYGWHRLFSRLFLVYGVWPGEWVERKLMGKSSDQPADVGKVLGGFVSSAFVHSFAAYTVAGGILGDALGEAEFFAGCGVAVVAEEIMKRLVLRHRRRIKHVSGDERIEGLDAWYDGIIGRLWWASILLYNGRHFARGWVKAGLVREMAGA
ncbi:MAG: hypothetical protein Q9166_005732 [cf. Caloplaca sp. 2 TL-2023]